MPSMFDQYSGIAGQIADQNGIPRPYLFGVIQQESGWQMIPGDNGAAFGFGQLHAGAAADMGVNRFDPVQNIQGTAAYLKKQYNKYGNWNDAFSAYNQGHAGTSAGANYANSVWKQVKSYFGGSGGGPNIDAATVTQGAACAAGDPMACASAAGSLFGGGGGAGSGADSNGCGTFDFVCKLKAWITSSEFFTRLALASLALLFILGGLYLMKERS